MYRYAAILAFTILTILAMFFVDPIHQDQKYHQFADHRHLIGIDNFLNVISNLPFMIIAALGFLELRKYKTLKLDSQSYSATYLAFFSGVLLTGIGSAYYHYAPSNSTLIWDRLPMTK